MEVLSSSQKYSENIFFHLYYFILASALQSVTLIVEIKYS